MLQVHSMVEKLAQSTDIRAALVVGGLSLQVQASTLKTSPEIVVATPVSAPLTLHISVPHLHSSARTKPVQCHGIMLVHICSCHPTSHIQALQAHHCMTFDKSHLFDIDGDLNFFSLSSAPSFMLVLNLVIPHCVWTW